MTDETVGSYTDEHEDPPGTFRMPQGTIKVGSADKVTLTVGGADDHVEVTSVAIVDADMASYPKQTHSVECSVTVGPVNEEATDE